VLETQPWLEEHRGGKSVTELEILHGVLNNPEMAGRALFYFRSAGYAQTKGEDHLPVSAENQAKQQALKARIRESNFPVVEDYETPQAVADQIQHDIWEALDAEFPAADIPDAFTRDLLQHEAYAAPRRRIYLGGERYLENLNRALEGSAQWILIEGESGSGKSALLANWIDQLSSASNDLIIHTHFLGANPSAADPVALVRRLIERIRRETNTDEEPASDPDTLLDALPEWLARASAWAELNNKRFLIVLDSLNGLAERRELRWFPSMMPPRVHCVVSTLPGEVRERLDDKAQWHRIQVERLDRKTTRQVFAAYLSLFNKTLPEPLIDQVMGHPLVTNPLFLLTLAEELRLFGEHERLSEQLSYYQESKTVDDLFERVLARIEADHGAAVIRQIMTALWAARGGMREEELLAYTGLAPMKWAYIRHALGPALIETTGRYVFAHDYLRIAVSDRYMDGNNHLEDEGQSKQALALRQEAHIRLAEWFEANAFRSDQQTITNARAAEEIPYQWQKAQQWERLAQSLTELELFKAHTEHRDQAELLGYWLDIEANTERTLEQAYETAWEAWGLDKTLEETGDLADAIGFHLHDAGRYTDFAVKMAELALQIDTETYGHEGVEASTRLATLAELLHSRGDLDAAEPLYRRALEIAENALGPDHPETGISLNNLALLFKDRGDLDNAELLARKALEIAENALGPDHPETGTRLNNLAMVLKEYGDLNAAEPLYRRALEIAENALGKEHPETAARIHNIAVILERHDDLIGADSLLRKSLRIAQNTLGPSHPDTARNLQNLGSVLARRGDVNVAELYLRDALSLLKKALGPDHPDNAIVLIKLARVYEDRSDFDKAVIKYRAATTILEAAYGSRNYRTGVAKFNLARALESSGYLDLAEPLYREALLIADKELGESHNETLFALQGLANLLTKKGKLVEAENLYNRAGAK
jgi:nephrocystin-3